MSKGKYGERDRGWDRRREIERERKDIGRDRGIYSSNGIEGGSKISCYCLFKCKIEKIINSWFLFCGV